MVACHLLGIVNYHPEVQLLKTPLLEKTNADDTTTADDTAIVKATNADGTTPVTAPAADNTTTAADNTTTAADNITTAAITAIAKVANADVTTNAKATIADNTTIVEATTADDSRAQINPMEKQMVPEKVRPIDTSKQQPTIPQLEQVPEPSKLATRTMQVRLIRAVRIPANCSAVVPVQVKGLKGLALLEPKGYLQSCLNADESLVEVQENGSATMLIVNNGTLPCFLKKNTEVAQAVEAELLHKLNGKQELSSEQNVDTEQSGVEMDSDLPIARFFNVSLLPDDNVISTERIKWRQQKLNEILIQSRGSITQEENTQLSDLLMGYHEVFSLEDGERGETDLVEFKIDTGDAIPKRQAVRRIPFAARQEITDQLEKMQASGVIEPSESPWASPVVLVRKKDGTLRFCVDYRALNSVTKPDLFPLLRINDLLDQLGKCKCFTTLDLKSGYWQIKVHADSQEKTAFITHQGLFEFKVMPFGVTNAPAAFQRLMQRVLAKLQSETSAKFVSVYSDDVIVFSKSLMEHIKHLKMVFNCLKEAGLKLNPEKCRILCEEVEYLGLPITPGGLRPNSHNIDAVKDFPVPMNIKQLRQFLGLTSHYQRFAPNYARIAFLLHALTRKGALFQWTANCEVTFETLKTRLVTAPLLCYPDFDKDFVLETDASKQGLGAILSQYQIDHKLHPVAYASRSISSTESNYAITDLETLAVVWAVTHFRYYLYGHKVTVITDHAAVKAILGAPSLSRKHARWWSKVHGSSIKQVEIVHRSGKTNQHTDCLSGQPVWTAPNEDTADEEIQLAKISTQADSISDLLQMQPEKTDDSDTLSSEQLKDKELQPIILYLKEGTLPTDQNLASQMIV